MIDLKEILSEEVLFQMSLVEKSSLVYLLNKLPSKKVGIEIGTYCGGSLNIISKYLDKVYSLDLNHECIDKNKYSNVEWITGDSNLTLPELIENINNSEEEVNFILIDGNHEFQYVLNDINNILKLKPKGDIVLLIHDSWYIKSRRAIIESDLNSNPYVYYVNTDFCTGDLMFVENKMQFMGGFCLVLISSEQQKEFVKIKQSQDFMYLQVNRAFQNEI